MVVVHGIVSDLINDDYSTFQCHKTVHCSTGGEWDDNGEYIPSGNESMCAGAATYLIKAGRPTVRMRMAHVMGIAKFELYDDAKELIIDPIATS